MVAQVEKQVGRGGGGGDLHRVAVQGLHLLHGAGVDGAGGEGLGVLDGGRRRSAPRRCGISRPRGA